MVDPASGPFLFDTSAESWLARSSQAELRSWFRSYLSVHPVHVSAITVVERMRGYGLLLAKSVPQRRAGIEAARQAYLRALGTVWAVNAATAVAAAEIMVLLPHPPSPPKRTHRFAERHAERLVRWRFDILIAATALVAAMPLVHNNPADFETIRGTIERSPGRFPGLGPLELISCARLV